MPPIQAMDHIEYGRFTNVVFLSQSFLSDATCRVASTYIPDILIGQTCSDLGFTARPSFRFRPRAVPTFAVTILGVFSGSSHEQMVRIDALRVVAAMTNVHPFGYRALREFVRDAVCADRSTEDLESPVPALMTCKIPRPAVGTGTRAIGAMEAVNYSLRK